MRSPLSFRANLRHRTISRRMRYPADFQVPSCRDPSSKGSTVVEPESVYDAWLASREIPGQPGSYLVPGAPRALNTKNAQLALYVTRTCTLDFLRMLWMLNPFKTTLMMALNIIRSLFPAFRGYSQALIVDELQSLIASESFTWSRLLYLVSTEVFRRVIEGCLDSYAASNESEVLGSARFYIEHKQMEQRLRLDVPTLADPTVRVLLQESDLFARSFGGGGFGMLSPMDFINVISLTTEIASHLFLIVSLTRGAFHFGILFLSIFSTTLPFFLSWFNYSRDPAEAATTTTEAEACDRQERLRNLAYSDIHRPEIALFGLSDWILQSWSSARKVVLSFEQPSYARNTSIVDQFNLTELVGSVQNIPLLLLLKGSSTSLGSLTVYRSSIQSLVYASRNLVTTTKMVFQGLFLMSAFTAGMKLKPKLNPKREDMARYVSVQGGASIVARRGLSYTYPGSDKPALKNVNFSLKAGETLAIVGYNGSGKSTLAKILLRIVDYDKGSLLVNSVNVRNYHPAEYHSHLSAVFQGFSKFSSTLKENVGLGNIEKIGYVPAIQAAIHLAEADKFVESLPHGLKTMLATPGFESMSYPGLMNFGESSKRHDLSGGEWQKVALARAFMRAKEPGVDLLIFDEPVNHSLCVLRSYYTGLTILQTSSLDALAQSQITATLKSISRTPTGERTKTIIYITHSVSTARSADKIAMMKDGTITEFGTHEELLAKKDGGYATLYNAAQGIPSP
ncbi:hypothetical protein CVT25_008700 [Psilocybe cyanescens]|uniref:ABC transporter domain-containing protein n=1 Tax=Psilocybe cyanescens TaxID=93625 RepID=A0A409XNR1_PSICY|nr:hypothetical protein CVT25_008700 [Psilocybe cyanescens]